MPLSPSQLPPQVSRPTLASVLPYGDSESISGEDNSSAFDRPTIPHGSLWLRESIETPSYEMLNEDRQGFSTFTRATLAPPDLEGGVDHRSYPLAPRHSQRPTLPTQSIPFDLSSSRFPHAATLRMTNSIPELPLVRGDLEEGSALSLIAARNPHTPAAVAPPSVPQTESSSPTIGSLVWQMQSHHALGDFSGTLHLAETILSMAPGHREATHYAEVCHHTLVQMHVVRLGSLRHVPRVSIPLEKVRWLSLDHRAGFILSCIDGLSSVEEILDVCGMPSLDALRILHELAQERIISIHE